MCCHGHGEKPHLLGWRFIDERRAVNLEPNCRWARSKADVRGGTDAFEVIGRLNSLLNANASRREEPGPVKT